MENSDQLIQMLLEMNPAVDAKRDLKQQVEQLMGRLDAIKGEIVSTQQELDKFSSQNLVVEARETKDDLVRLQSRKRQLEQELQKLKKFW